MRYGLEIPCGGTGLDLGTLVDLAVLAEASGWGAVFFEDYLVHYAGDDPPTFDPWVMLAAVAVRTSHLRIGTTVTALPRRDPRKLAREATTLDHLCAGRVTLAVGAGDPADRGAPSTGRRGPLTDERLGELLALLSGEPVGDVTFRPPPVQRPRLPVWVGGSTQAGHVQRRAARADGIVPYKATDTGTWSDFTPAEVEALIAEVDAHRAPGPARPGPFDVALGGRRRRPDEAAERAYLAALESAGATWWLEFVPPGTPEEMARAVARGPLR